MLFNQLEIANKVALHDLINEQLLPEKGMELGDRDRYSFRDADTKLKRVGNRTGVPEDGCSYLYVIEGEGFRAELRAVLKKPTAGMYKVILIEVTDPIALNCWLRCKDLEQGYDEAVALASMDALPLHQRFYAHLKAAMSVARLSRA